MSSEIFKSVLLVEDDSSHAYIIKRALKFFAREVKHASSLGAALDELKAFKPELIVTDLHLPDSGDIRDIERLRAGSADAPIIVLTSSTSLNDAVEAMKLGARDFIVKHFDSAFKEVLGLALARLCTALLREEENRKLKKDMEALQVAIENSNDALAVVDAKADVKYANRSFYAFAARCGSGTAHNLLAMLSPQVNKFEALRENIKRSLGNLAAGGSWHTEVTFEKDDSVAFDLNLSLIRVALEADGRVERECVVWVRDVSEVKRREKFQREILSTTSHDLKGPLGAISLSSDLLSDMLDKTGKAHEIALRIGSSAQGAIHLIDEFLSARRIQEGTFILKPSRQRIGALITDVIDSYNAIIASKKIALQSEVDEECEASVDKLGFCRVIGNLVNNALKFTPKEGKVWIRAGLVEDELQVEVEDTGSGMEPSEVRKIFDRFTRLERHGEIAGSGLGLFIVKSIVTAHGGKIEVTSHVGTGTTFKIRLPRVPPVNQHGELISLVF